MISVKNILKDENILMNFLFAIIFLLPNAIPYYIIIYLFLFLTMTCKLEKPFVTFFLIISIILSFFSNINSFFTSKDIFIALNIVFLLIFYPFFKKPFEVSQKTIFVIVLSVFISQLAFLFEFNLISQFIENIYSTADTEEEFTRFITGALRNGGLYYNPNQACKYLTILLAYILTSVYTNKIKIILSSLIFISILLTGSRTGFLIGALIFMGYLLFIKKSKVLFIFLSVLIGLILFITGTETRSFQIQETGSFDYKIGAFLDYWLVIANDGYIVELLLGNFSINYENLSNTYNLSPDYAFGFDSEFGFLLSAYGMLFSLFYLIYMLLTFKRLPNKYLLFVIPFILWPFTSTILFSVKTSLVYFIVLGSVSVQQNKFIYLK